jgi:hypothetical protein
MIQAHPVATGALNDLHLISSSGSECYSGMAIAQALRVDVVRKRKEKEKVECRMPTYTS